MDLLQGIIFHKLFFSTELHLSTLIPVFLEMLLGFAKMSKLCILSLEFPMSNRDC